MSNDRVGKEKNSSLWYKISVAFLALTIVGLVIGIAITNNKRVEDEVSDASDKISLPEELMGDNLSPEDQVIKETSVMVQTPGVSMEEIEKYYDNVINDANKNEDYDLAVRIIIQKMLFLVVTEKDCEKAKDYSDSIDTSMYPEDEASYLQSYIYSTMWNCEKNGEAE